MVFEEKISKKLNLNQRKVLAEILINLITVLVSIFIVSKIFYERKFDFDSILAASVAFILLIIAIFILYRDSKKSKR